MAISANILFEPIEEEPISPAVLFQSIQDTTLPAVSTRVDITPQDIQPLFGIEKRPSLEEATIGPRSPSLREQILVPSVSGGFIGGAKHKFASFAEGLTGTPFATDVFGETNAVTEFVGTFLPVSKAIKVGNAMFQPVKRIIVKALTEEGESVAKKTALAALQATAGGAVFETSRVASERFSEEIAGIDTESPDVVDRIIGTSLGFGLLGGVFTFIPAHLKRKVGKQVGRELKLTVDKQGSKLELTPRETSKLNDVATNMTETLYSQSYTERADLAMNFGKRMGRESGARTDISLQPEGRVEAVTAQRSLLGIPESAKEVSQIELDAVQRMNALKRLPGKLGEAAALFENPIRTFEKLSSDAKEMFYRPVKVAEKAAFDRTLESRNAFKKVKSGLGRKSSERIAVYAYAQQKPTLDIAFTKRVSNVPTLTKKEQGAYDWMREQLAKRYEQIQQARQITGQKLMGRTENYFSFFRNLEASQKRGYDIYGTGINSVPDQLLKAKSVAFRFGRKRPRDEYGVLEFDSFGIFERYNELAFKHIELSPTLAKSRRIIDSRYANGFRLDTENPDAYRFINNWINAVAGAGVKPEFPLLERGLLAINRNLLFATLSMNFRSALIQPSAFVNTTTALGPKWAQRGIMKTMQKGSKEFAFNNSNVLSGRAYDAAVVEAFGTLTSGVGKARESVAKAGLAPLRILDLKTAEATWHGAYLKGVNELKLSSLRASQFADDIVIKTQASATISDRAPIQRTVLGRTLTLYQTFVINNWGFLTQDVMGIGRPEVMTKEAFEKASTWIAGATAMNIVFEDILGTHSPFPSPLTKFTQEMAKEDPSVAGASFKAALELLDIAPVLSSARFGSSPAGAQSQVWYDLAKQVSQSAGPKRKLPRIAGQLLGIPGTVQADKTLRELKKKRKEEEKELKELLKGL